MLEIEDYLYLLEIKIVDYLNLLEKIDWNVSLKVSLTAIYFLRFSNVSIFLTILYPISDIIKLTLELKHKSILKINRIN